MKISEYVAALVRIAAEHGDLLVLQGADDGKVYPREPEMSVESARVGSMLVLR